MSDQTPTAAEVDALYKTWQIMSSIIVDVRKETYAAYMEAKKAYEAGPDTQQILDEAIRAREVSAEEHNRHVFAERAAYDAWADTYRALIDAVIKAKAAHAKATG
jgi:hypothetical protein